MKTDIEEYIQHNREALDIDTPPAELWAGIEKGLVEENEKKRSGWAWLKIAATGALLIGVGYVLNDLVHINSGDDNQVAQITENPKSSEQLKQTVIPGQFIDTNSAANGLRTHDVNFKNVSDTTVLNLIQGGTFTMGRTEQDVPGQMDGNQSTPNLQQQNNANQFGHNLNPNYKYKAPESYNGFANVSTTDVSCSGSSDGTIAAANGGTTPYTYHWSPPPAGSGTTNSSDGVIRVTTGGENQKFFGGIEQVTAGYTTATGSDLASGTYSVNVTDANGCNNNGTVATTNSPTSVSTTTSSNTATFDFDIASNINSTVPSLTSNESLPEQPNAFVPAFTQNENRLFFSSQKPVEQNQQTQPGYYNDVYTTTQGQDLDIGMLNKKGQNNVVAGDEGGKAFKVQIGAFQQSLDGSITTWDFGNGEGRVDGWALVDTDEDGIPDFRSDEAGKNAAEEAENRKAIEKLQRDRWSAERYAPIVENVFRQSLHEPLSTFSIDVDGAGYSNVRRMINAGQVPPPNSVKIEEMVNYFDYDYPQPKGEHPFAISTEVAKCPWNARHKLVRIGIQGKDVKVQQLPPSNLVFLIDVSGSMSSANKLPLLKKSMKLLVDQLRPEDNIAIVTYAGTAGVMLEPTSGGKKTVINAVINRLGAGGSTAGEAGIRKAYQLAQKNYRKDGNNRVILATDGDFNVGISGDDALVELIEKKRETGVFLSVLGFGTGNYQDAKMEKLADNGNGNFSYIDNMLESKKVMVTEMAGTLFTIAKDVKLQIEFNPAKVKSYRLIGYENRMLENKDFDDDTKDAGELGAGHEVTALYEINPIEDDVPWWRDGEELKYQKLDVSKEHAEEIMTLKFRYKEPDGKKSKLIVNTLKDSNSDNPSENFKFAAAVAEFGLLMRNSRFKGTASYEHVLNWAKAGKGTDINGYRAEFIQLVEKHALSVKAK